MKRKIALLLAFVVLVGTLASLALQRQPAYLPLEWANKGDKKTPPVAILIELGLADEKPQDWSGSATVAGAKVVRREGYRFRDKDKLVDPNDWEVTSKKPLRLVGPKQIINLKVEPVATVGVLLYLEDIKPEATLALNLKGDQNTKAEVPLKDVLAGKPVAFANDHGVVRLVSTATPAVTAKTEDDFPAAAYGPDGTLWIAYISYALKDEGRRIEQAQFKEEPKDFKALHTPEFGDQLFIQYYRDGAWSRPAAVTGPREDLVRCAIAVDGKDTAWVIYSAFEKGQYDMFVRAFDRNTPEAVKNPIPRMRAEHRLTQSAGADINPVACTDQNGNPWVAFQAWNDKGFASIQVHSCIDGKWKLADTLGRDPKNCWHPALAPAPDGTVAVAFDEYSAGDYDVRVYFMNREKTLGDLTVAASPKFEARPALAYDPQGRLWVAYEEGPAKWGKDFGALDTKDGQPLYSSRSVRVVCVEKGKLSRPTAELPTAEVKLPVIPYGAQAGPSYERNTRYAYPKIGIDGKGRVWLAYREKFGSRYSSHPGSYWLTFVRRLDGDKWSPPVELIHSDGLLDHRPVLLPHATGGLLVVHNTDGRLCTPETIDNQIYVSVVNLPGDPVDPKLAETDAGKKDPKQADAEKAVVEAIRKYRVDAGGKQYQLFRGEFHRHTEISWDGGPDGSLEDMFRYAVDAVQFDWIGNGDHDNGGGREYSWWLTQKFTDAYHAKKVFVPMFTYERSVAYPHGHRNCVFAQRGVRTLPRLAAEKGKAVAGVHADDTKMLYKYLKEHNGICAVHTSATGMGTDWRDNDPVVEPLVEIYQGCRMSYESEGFPRAGYDPQDKKAPAQIGGWQPAGFINLALAKGYKLGFQASSDHWSTHISYCIVLAERPDREAILDAMKKRHVYGATDDIIVDFRSGQNIMGDAFQTKEAPKLEMTVIGAKNIKEIAILKDSEVVETIKVGKKDYKGAWTDPKPTGGVHYYYIRVLQEDEELAWASPMWIDYMK